MADQRTTLLRSMLPTDGRGLEIGPGFNPLLPKAEGFQIETADYTDADGLRTKYRDNPHVDVTRIEMVDHVLDQGRTFAEVVGRPQTFNYIVASHVIEHTPDMLGFLKSCETLLASDGVLLLAVPDKRHCFDVLQPLSSTGAVLQAHLDRRTRPTPGAVFDEVASNAVRGGAIGVGLTARLAGLACCCNGARSWLYPNAGLELGAASGSLATRGYGSACAVACARARTTSPQRACLAPRSSSRLSRTSA